MLCFLPSQYYLMAARYNLCIGIEYLRSCYMGAAGQQASKTCLQEVSLKSWVTAGLTATVIWAWSSSRILDL